MHNIPKDLVSYLEDLISPRQLDDCAVHYVSDVSEFPWTEIPDTSVHGLIVQTPEGSDLSLWQDEIWRVLKPGAHLLLIAPQDQPTGHTGVTLLEDKGFEVRDAILVVQEAGRLHYVAKPSQRERHAGCELLARKTENLFEYSGSELDAEILAELLPPEKAETILDGTLGISEQEIPEGYSHLFTAQSSNSGRGNFHPTVKSKGLMAKLLKDVPQGTVLDPFLGSGSTGLGCLETGHGFVGIEREEAYLQIADARIRHWDSQQVGDGASITSDVIAVKTKKTLSLDDFFGG